MSESARTTSGLKSASLKPKAIAFCVLLLLGAVGGFGTAVVIKHYRGSLLQIRDKATVQARSISNSAELHVMLHDLAALQQEVENATWNESVAFAQIADARGEVLARHKAPQFNPAMPEDAVCPSHLALAAGEVHFERTGRQLLVVAPIWPATRQAFVLDLDEGFEPNPTGKPVGFVSLIYSLDPVYAELRGLAFFCLSVCLGVIGLATGITVLMLRRVLTPVAELMKAAEAIAQGSLSHRANEDGPGEIGGLARSFNTMAETLRDYTETLESQVRQRTAELMLQTDELRSEILEREQAEESLQNQQALLSNVLSNIPHAVFWKDAQSVYLGCNDAFARLAGADSPALIVGKTDHELAWREGDADWYQSLDQEVMGEGESILDREQKRITAAGQEITCLVSKVPLRGRQGEITGVLGMFTDITERKRMEDQLMQIQMALDDAGDAIAVVLASGELGYVNLAFTEQFHATKDMVNELGWASIYEDSAAAQQSQEAIQSGESWSGETVMVSTQGHSFPAEVRATPVINDEAEIAGMLLIINDITERKQLESQLLQAHKLESIGQLAAGIAHEINTPMQYIGDSTRFLQTSFEELATVLQALQPYLEPDETDTEPAATLTALQAAIEADRLEFLCEEIPEALTDALEGIERVSEIVKAMKEFSHPGVEGKTETDLNQAIQSTLTIARNEWKYVADVEMEFDEKLPTVPCLAGEINQVVLNILVNAAHSIADVTKDGAEGRGTITVTTRQEGDWAEIRISDTGAGIPEAVQSRIFDPFFTTKDVGKGTGQGLAIAHAVVAEKHGGTLTFETIPGQGTTFIIRLPLRGVAEDDASQGDLDGDDPSAEEVMHVG